MALTGLPLVNVRINGMTHLFLKAKHWQLFLLTFGIPMIIQLSLMAGLFASIGSGTTPDTSFMLGYMTFFPLMMALFTAVLFGWFWSVAIGLQKKLPEPMRLNLKKFRICFFIPLIYVLCILVFMSAVMRGMIASPVEPDGESLGRLVAIIVPLHLFAIFCTFYSLYFVAKTLKTVELQRQVAFSDFAGEFFMIWFYPIGIWIVQPKINRMMHG
jgi:hypothetical protein